MARADTLPPTRNDRVGLPRLAGLTLNVRAVSLLEGVRAAIAVAGTMAVASLFGIPQLGLAALGALLTCFADPGGAVGTRVPAMLIFGVLGATAFASFGLILAHSPPAAIIGAGLVIFGCSFARIYGQAGLQGGNLLAVAIVLSLDEPSHSALAALHTGLAFWGGAVGAAVLTLALWRIRPFGPARVALADLAVALASLARDAADLSATGSAHPDADGFDLRARAHRRAVREAIERARTITYDTLRRRGAASARANALALRLATFDQMFGAMIGLGEAVAAEPDAKSASIPIIAGLASLLDALATEIEADRPLDSPAIATHLASLRVQAATIAPDAPLNRLFDVVLDRLAVIISVSRAPGPVLPADGGADPWSRLSGPVRANLTVQSVSLRHAFRTVVVTTPTLGVVYWLGDPFGHWLAITMIIVLQPHFSATWVRALERVSGTVAGGLLAAAIGLLCHTSLDLAIVMALLALVAFAIKGVNYSAFIAVLTPMIVLLIEQIEPGSNQWIVALSRVGFTVAGGLIAVAATLTLWPSFEGNRLGAACIATIAAHRRYVAGVFAALLDGAAPPEAARRQAGLASNNLEASIARALIEPHRSHDPLLRAALITDAALRRIAGRLALLVLESPRPGQIDRWRTWQSWFDTALAPKGSLPARPAPLADSTAAEGMARLARQAELVNTASRQESFDER